MATERLIGIDFGTSTTVIRVKRYRDGEPISDRLETKAVTFNVGSTMVPTLVQQVGDVRSFGHEAANANKRDSQLYQNFKVELESEDVKKREQARSLTRNFLKYLAGVYREQSEAGHLGDPGDRERTLISYPVKWKEETKRFMVEAARDAGFPNVEGMDEASAAIQAVTVQNADMLAQKGYFKAGVPMNILLIDMGAGTTDLVLCRHTPGKKSETMILCTWPKSGNTFFGGSQVDVMLREYIKQYIPVEVAEKTLKRCGVEQFKSWKEKTVSPALSNGEIVNYCAPVQGILEWLDLDLAAFSLDRTVFEAFNKDYLGLFPRMIDDCLREARVLGKDIDLVILTGGHSQWYFVKEMLGRPNLGLVRIIEKPERIVSIALPQETVALGLVYTPMCNIKDNNPHTAVELYMKAAEQGSATAQYNLARCYEHGEGIGESQDEAAKWYKCAAEQGYADAQMKLGLCYEKGRGVKKDCSEAIQWYQKAAEQGNELAQASLGLCYLYGTGVAKDYNEALKWFRKSADNGCETAHDLIKCTLELMSEHRATGTNSKNDYLQDPEKNEKWKHAQSEKRKMIHIAAMKPNCISDGNIEYYAISVIKKGDDYGKIDYGACYLDAAGTQPIAYKDTRIPALGHDFSAIPKPQIDAFDLISIVSVVRTLGGRKYIYKCRRCGAIMEEKIDLISGVKKLLE